MSTKLKARNKKKVNSREKKYNIELGFISKLLETKDMKLLKDKGIKSLFFTGENKRVFLYIQSVFKETGEIPTPRVIGHKFPDYELETYVFDGVEIVGNEESLMYWCSELRIKAKHNKIADTIENVAELLTDGETESAYKEYQKALWQIENDIVESSTVNITENTEDRKQAYLDRKKNKGMMGIPMGIPHLDYMLKGLINGTLTTLIATTGVGKTWFLILIACYAELQGYTVVIFLTEMQKAIMQDRIDAMLFGMICGGFDYNKFKSGSLDPETEEEYFDFLDNELPKLESLFLEDATGVSSVVAVIENKKPDLVLIDGAYLMEDEQGAKDDWLRVTHITRDLKKIANNRDIPILINTQADQNTTKKTGPGLSDIKYSQAIGQDSDNILALYRDEVMLNDREMGVRVLKQREGVLGKAVINWDFQRMNFKSIYAETEGDFESEVSDDEDTSAVIGMD